jgi:ParB family transcriptional regulator, chromosome partitioning protein
VDSCLQIEAEDQFTSPFPGLGDFSAAKAIAIHHKAFAESLPEEESGLWDFLLSLDQDNRETLFAHCASRTINAVREPRLRISQKKRHADQLASALCLDMTKAGWVTRADNYLARITKAQTIAAVHQASVFTFRAGSMPLTFDSAGFPGDP